MILEIEKNLELLRKPSQLVEEFNDELKTLVLNMKETMKALKGVGLAASQVKVFKRIIVVEVWGDNIVMINPVILSFNQKETFSDESCLSIPNKYLRIKRWSEVRVSFSDINGQKKEMALRDLSARIFQHELDHLNGILIIDRI